jgi:hypothetical protein
LANIINTYLGNIKMEIFILIGIVLAGLVVLLWYRSNKNTKVTTEPVVVETAPYKVPEPVATTSVTLVAEPVQEAVVVIDEVVPEVVKPVKKPKAKKPTAAQATTPKPKRTRKPKA